ncbi:hypothetical protein B0J15DRAFT_483514 [Fusarium solani]|uniref:Uncharacterized protein n=1 Tax=Fusarium solani TaxID=169388 RepID=A0A9P9RCK2_FUSSL|nr:uncharacterized protein B0J15DRAFT_483514 [Fusarium solani]KAH7273100.1 hypothetical protein B0J15DRAFT_483514 [Fusarium solani]
MYLRIDFANDCNVGGGGFKGIMNLRVGFGKYDFMYLRADFANDCNVGGGGCLNEKTTVYSLSYPIKSRASTITRYANEINTLARLCLRRDKGDRTQVGEEEGGISRSVEYSSGLVA